MIMEYSKLNSVYVFAILGMLELFATQPQLDTITSQMFQHCVDLTVRLRPVIQKNVFVIVDILDHHVVLVVARPPKLYHSLLVIGLN